jgi:hypothetical protein
VIDPEIAGSRDAYITLLGRSTWALVNAYHAVLREKGLRPERVSIVTEELYAEGAPTAARAILMISEGYGFTPAIEIEALPRAEFVRAGAMIRSFAEDLIAQGYGVAIDITSGRKVTVAGALIAISLVGIRIQHIYYLAMQSLDDVAKPYMMIPHQIQKIRDLMEDTAA